MITKLILSLFALGLLFVMGVMVIPVLLRDARKKRLIVRLTDWFFRDGLPMILLFLGACGTLLLFWILDATGFNHVSR